MVFGLLNLYIFFIFEVVIVVKIVILMELRRRLFLDKILVFKIKVIQFQVLSILYIKVDIQGCGLKLLWIPLICVNLADFYSNLCFLDHIRDPFQV